MAAVLILYLRPVDEPFRFSAVIALIHRWRGLSLPVEPSIRELPARV